MHKKRNYKVSHVSLNGDRPEIHDRFSSGNSFSDSIRKIKKFIKSGLVGNIVLDVNVYNASADKKTQTLRTSNYFRLNGILKLARKLGIRKIRLNLINPHGKKLAASLPEVASHIAKAKYAFSDLSIKIAGLPYCLIREPDTSIIQSENHQNFIKFKQCLKCAYKNKCDGILKGYSSSFNKDKIRPKKKPGTTNNVFYENSEKNKVIRVFLNGDRREVHDRFSENEEDFEKTIKKIRQYSIAGLSKYITLIIGVFNGDEGASNYFRLNGILKIAKRFGIRKVQFNIVDITCNNKSTASLAEVASYVAKAKYSFLFDMLVKVKGLPYCLIPEPEELILKNEKPENFVKFDKCNGCAYSEKCDGILKGYASVLDKDNLVPKKLPKEIMVEVTPRCNFNCEFCFNKISFEGASRLNAEPSLQKLKKLIDKMAQEKIPAIRFTGGEPLLRKDILQIMKYAKSKGLEVRMNSNAYLIGNYKTARTLAKYLDYILISMHAIDAQAEEAITGVKGSFKNKLKAIGWLRKAGVKSIRTNTVATLENIKNLNKFYKMFVNLRVDKWQVDRPIPAPGERNVWGKKELPLLIEKMVKIKKDIVAKNIPLRVHIVNAVPLCAYDPIKLNSVCSGARSVDGHERYVIDPRWFAKPMYYIIKNIGNPLEIKKSWTHPFMKFLKNYANLPKPCRHCALVNKCKGGNRYCANFFNGSYFSSDPLMDYRNVKDYIW